jgi:hypothetical protein
MTDKKRSEEAQAALKRLEQQSEKLITGATPEDHGDDKIEILGKRIARVLSVIMLIGLIVYLWLTYFR